MIILYYLFSTIINEKYILYFIFILFFELFISLIFMFFEKSSNYWIIGFISILSGALCSILLQFLWIKNITAFIWIIVLSTLIGIYLTIVLYTIKKYYEDKIFIAILTLNYSFFSLVTFVVAIILYALFQCCKSCKKHWDNINLN